IGIDDVTVGGTPVGTFGDANVGTGKPVTITGNTISGSDAGNYSFTQESGQTADISAAALTITATNQSHTYGFGGTSSALGTSGFSVTGTVYTGDSITGVTLATNDTTSTSGNYKAGTYNLTPSSATGTGVSNYDITYVTDIGGLDVA